MKKPLLVITIGYLLGIIGGLSIENGIVLFCTSVFVLLVLYKIKKKQGIYYFAYFVIPFMIAYLITAFQLSDYQNAYQQENLKIIGIIISEKKDKTYKEVYKIKIESVNGDSSFKGKNLFLNCPKGKNLLEIQYGDRIYFEGEYEKPTERRNKGGFDYASYLRSIGIYGNIKLTGKVKVIEKEQVSFFPRLAYQFRQLIRKKVNLLLGEEKGSLLLGLLIGDISGVSEETQKYFRDSSLSHLLAVSGAQVSYILMGMESLMNKIRIGKQKARLIAVGFLLFFLEVTGYSPSVTRAGIMGIVGLIAGILHRKPNTWNGVFFSLLLLMLQNPFCIFDLGLQLSFVGTAGILLFQGKIKRNILVKNKTKEESRNPYAEKIKKNVIDILVVTIAAQVMIFPITLYQFGTISFTFFISNLLAGLLIGPITFLGCIFCFLTFVFFPFAKLFAFFLQSLLSLLVLISKYSSILPFSKVYFPIPSFFVLLLYYSLLLYSILPIFKNSREKIKRKIRLHKFLFYSSICILISLIGIFSLIPDDFRLHFIDVGQGDSSLIISPYGKTILIDGGGSKQGEGFDVGEQTLLPYLLHQEITTLDYIMISHFDADHCNGLIPVLERLKVKCVMISRQASISDEFLTIAHIIEKKKIPIIVVENGMEIQIDKRTKLLILHPQKLLLQDGKGGLNCNAIVAKVCCQTAVGEKSILFTGDIEEEAEKVLIENREDLKADILKVGHHGSKTSTTSVFLDSIKPKIALIGVGKKNTFGHPNSQVIKRLEEEKIKIYRTDLNGEISISITNKGGIKIETQIKN